MKKNKKVEIEELKNYADLSNKKWDKTIKSLTKNKLLKVFKNDSGIFVELIQKNLKYEKNHQPIIINFYTTTQ